MKKIVKILSMIVALTTITPISVFAQEVQSDEECLISINQDSLEAIILEIQDIKAEHPDFTEEKILEIMNARHGDGTKVNQRGVVDIWNALTNSERKLCIRYPFDALKVNTAKDIATTQTEIKFGTNGLGNQSDAFRHGIWNAKMVDLIGKTKAELFATAHEDKDVTGNESDGYPKTAHREMDLHNNEIGRSIGEKNKGISENEMAEIVYQEVTSSTTEFIWLHE